MGVASKSKLQSTTCNVCSFCSDRKLHKNHTCCCRLQTIEKRRHDRNESTVLRHEDGWLPAPFSKIPPKRFYGGSNCTSLLQSSPGISRLLARRVIIHQDASCACLMVRRLHQEFEEYKRPQSECQNQLCRPSLLHPQNS